MAVTVGTPVSELVAGGSLISVEMEERIAVPLR